MDINFENILTHFEIDKTSSITQIYRSAWDIDDAYVLKSSANQGEFDKSIKLNRLLLSESVPVIEYIDTTDGKPFVYAEDRYWCLMKKIKGTVFDPFIDNPKHNGIILGRAVAELHIAMKSIEDKIDAYDTDFGRELSSWILSELEKSEISFADGVIDKLQTFFQQDYKSLPRQLIHRDIHTSNLLFENGILSGYLDFDMSQRNVRVFDIVYLGCSQLVENYKDEACLKKWCKIFSGMIQGYTELSPLNENEVKAMPALFVFDEVLFTAFYSKTGQPETAKSCMEMANWLYENIATLIC